MYQILNYENLTNKSNCYEMYTMYMFVSLHFRTLSHLQSISYQQKDTITNKQEGVFNNENKAIR